jgi:hypothetical protein
MRRGFPALILSLLLAVTSVTQAIARGQGTGVTEAVICANGMAITVLLDAQGNPVPQHAHCPDCLVLAHAAGDTARLPEFRPAARPDPVVALRPLSAPPAPIAAAAPRGPPVLS